MKCLTEWCDSDRIYTSCYCISCHFQKLINGPNSLIYRDLEVEVSDDAYEFSYYTIRNRPRRTQDVSEPLLYKNPQQIYYEPIISAFLEIKDCPEFIACLDNQTGWTNAEAWFLWLLRNAAPSFMGGNSGEQNTASHQLFMWTFGINDKQEFRKNYLLELSKYLDKCVEETTINCIFSSATLIFGPLLAPYLIVSHGVGHVAAALNYGVKKSAEIATNYAARKIAIEKNEYNYTENINPMRYTLAWLEFILNYKGNDYRKQVNIIQTEFGGRKNCELLYEILLDSGA
jgi:hypothetical protein